MKKIFILLLILIFLIVIIATGVVLYRKLVIEERSLGQLFDPIEYDIKRSAWICPNGNVAQAQRLDAFRNVVMLDGQAETAYICNEIFWIHTYGGNPGKIVDNWKGPYKTAELNKHIRPVIK